MNSDVIYGSPQENLQFICYLQISEMAMGPKRPKRGCLWRDASLCWVGLSYALPRHHNSIRVLAAKTIKSTRPCDKVYLLSQENYFNNSLKANSESL